MADSTNKPDVLVVTLTNGDYGSVKVLGDTLHTTTDAAIQEAIRQSERVQEEARFAETQRTQAQATMAQEEATNNVLGEFITQAGYSPMLAARARKSLQQLVRHEGAVVTSYAFVQALIAQGLEPNTREEDRIKPMSRMAEFRASNEEQQAHAKRVRDGGKKTVYSIGDYDVSSFEHAYAGYLATLSPHGGS